MNPNPYLEPAPAPPADTTRGRLLERRNDTVAELWQCAERGANTVRLFDLLNAERTETEAIFAQLIEELASRDARIAELVELEQSRDADLDDALSLIHDHEQRIGELTDELAAVTALADGMHEAMVDSETTGVPIAPMTADELGDVPVRVIPGQPPIMLRDKPAGSVDAAVAEQLAAKRDSLRPAAGSGPRPAEPRATDPAAELDA